jgi:hypothetical protein
LLYDFCGDAAMTNRIRIEIDTAPGAVAVARPG